MSTKSQKNWVKIVDFLLKAYFWAKMPFLLPYTVWGKLKLQENQMSTSQKYANTIFIAEKYL